MSGPTDRAGDGDPGGPPETPVLEIGDPRPATVGSLTVRRALPRHGRRTVGAWCFADQMGPAAPGEGREGVGPHPHMGLHTVTWLLSGELVHRDSLGSEQPVRPGQLNLMTAGNGVSHAEAAVPGAAPLHGVQLWVAQPDETRHGPPAFTHHDRLPEVALGSVRATVLLGSLAGVASPARHDTELVGADLAQEPGRAAVPLTPGFEYAFLVTEGRPLVEGHRLEPGQMAYVGRGRVQLDLEADAPARGLLLGGVPFPETPAMWWNFVGRSRPEMVAAARAWNEEDGRFGSVASRLARIPAPDPPGPAPG